jgi:hypothetical protein
MPTFVCKCDECRSHKPLLVHAGESSQNGHVEVKEFCHNCHKETTRVVIGEDRRASRDRRGTSDSRSIWTEAAPTP